MKIYKLSDGGVDEKKTGDSFCITDLKAGMKNPNRVNVFVDRKYSFSLDVAQVVDLGVKKGRILTREEMAELKEASEFGKVYQRALEWVLVRPRSVKELRDYLKKRSIKEVAKERKMRWEKEREILKLKAKDNELGARRVEKTLASKRERQEYDFDNLVVERLCERGYVDDRKFAKWYVENRFVKKGISKKRMRMELMKKGLDQDIVDEVLGERTDEDEIYKLVKRKRAKCDDEKLIAYLCRQGFSYDLARQAVLDDEEGL